MDFQKLDLQLARFDPRLREAVGLKQTSAVATAISADVRALAPEAKAKVRSAGPVTLRDRLDELVAFQSWMVFAERQVGDPGIRRAQVVAQNYICFVYLGEACFVALRKVSAAGSTMRKCCEFLTENPVRAMRNAVAHANWSYRPDFRALVYWARKGAERDEPLVQFEVEQDELDFWQSLSRGVAYAAYRTLQHEEQDG